MQVEKLFLAIIADTFSLHMLTRRVQLLHDHMQTNLFAKGAWEVSSDIEESDAQWIAKFTGEKRAVLDDVTKENVSDVFKAIDEEIKKLKPLVLFLPISLPKNEIDMLGRSLRRDYGDRFFIDIRLDPLLIGGAALAWKGVYKDYSMRQKLKENRETIVASFQKYVSA